MPTDDHEPLPTAASGAAADRYDVVIVGGAVAGAASALLLRRFHPASRVLVVEPRERFGRKVGEATVEVSGFFLHDVLGLGEHLAAEHLPKHGLRFWFSDGEARRLEAMTEVGARTRASIPSFQLDRSRLDEALLAAAAEAGCEVLRPAKVTAWEEGWPESRVSVETAAGERTVRCRWLVDASGRQAFVARRKRLLERVADHPTAAAWSRWYGVADLDGPLFRGGDGRPPRLPRPGDALRRLATNHFCGYGWWCWMIPQSDGATSVGLVWDKSLFEPPGDGTLEERYQAFVTSRPGMDELLAVAAPASGDFHAYRHLPYVSRRYMAPGWALVGDAAAFLDPFYSPGLDHVAMSAWATARLVAADLAGELDAAGLERRVETHNARFGRSYRRWLEALYLGKYELFGDAELTACAYLVDTALYYLGIVTPVYRDREALGNPSFGLENRSALWAYRLMRLFNRRMNRIARLRRSTGRYGRRNAGRRLLGPVPELGRGALPMLVAGLRLWLLLEAGHLRSRLTHRGADLSRPVPAPVR
jgi:flavin-dependent dehydrogenase